MDVGAPEGDPHQQGPGAESRRMGKRPILVLWERKSNALFAAMLPNKAATTRYNVQSAVACIDRHWGFAGQRIVLKGDGEPALPVDSSW